MRGEKVKGKSCSCGSNQRYQNSNQCVNCAKVSANFRHERSRVVRVTQAQVAECYEQGSKAQSPQGNPYGNNEIGKRCAWQAGFNDNAK